MEAVHEGGDDGLRVAWPQLGARAQPALDAAARQARELARALCAHGLVTDPDAAPEEVEERLSALVDTVWPPGRALDGYELCSSLGAHIVAKVAFDLVPAGRSGLRHEPLKRAGLVAALESHGVDATTALSVLGDWSEVQPGFRGDPDGLSASKIAGLAERTLTRAERGGALNQIAVSPRCLNRLAATLSLLAAIRVLLPMVPPEALGPDALVAVVGLAVGRPDRVVELYADRARTLGLTTLVEIGQAQLALSHGEAVSLPVDPLVPAVSGEPRAPEPRGDTEVMADAFSDDDFTGAPPEEPEPSGSADEDAAGEDAADEDAGGDDILEIVEERADPDARLVPEIDSGAPPEPARCFGAEPDGEVDLEGWRARLADEATVAARVGGLLGLFPAPAPATVPPRAAPPDPGLLAALERRETPRASDEELTERIAIDPLLHGHGLEVEGLPFDPLFAPVRGLLRVVAAAAEGEAPAEDTVQAGGDLAWALARARALALVVQGDLTGAQAAVSGMPEGSAPEGRWARDRAVRFSGRPAAPVDPREARPVAAALLGEVAQQLARTLAGTVPTDG